MGELKSESKNVTCGNSRPELPVLWTGFDLALSSSDSVRRRYDDVLVLAFQLAGDPLAIAKNACFSE